MHYAVKVAYDGSLYHGSQRQGKEDPDSVQGAIQEALRRKNEFTTEADSVKFSSRTDSGVSAMGNIFSVQTDRDMVSLIKFLNSNLEGICCWSWGELREHQNIRWANSRWYRYHLPPRNYGKGFISDMNRAIMEFAGRHDFRRLCRSKEERNTETTVERALVQDLSGSGEMVVVDIFGPRFLWNQVRRMVSCAVKFAEGKLVLEDIREIIGDDPDEDRVKKIQSKISTMPPTGLVLMDVHFKDVEFHRVAEAAEIGMRRFEESAWKGSIRVLLHTALRGVSNTDPHGVNENGDR